MATSLNPWNAILRSIEKRRSYDARFYKPVCLIAAVDAALNGEIVPPIVNAPAVIERFRSYVSEVYPERAELGWQPFWHLSNDGVWHFTKEGQKVRPADFGVASKPDSRGQLLSRIDQAAIPDDMVPLWQSGESLSLLREALVEMLRHDDATCRSMAAVLAVVRRHTASLSRSTTRPGTGRRAIGVKGFSLRQRRVLRWSATRWRLPLTCWRRRAGKFTMSPHRRASIFCASEAIRGSLLK